MNWPSDVSVLAAVRHHPRQVGLANWVRRQYVGMDVSKRTAVEHMSRSLQRLEGDGLVTRKRSATDRRVWEYTAT